MDQRRGPGGNASREGFDLSDPARSFADTVREVLLDPRGFFSRLSPRGSPRNPLVFALACLLVSTLLEGAADYLAGGGTTSPSSLVGMALERGGASGTGMLVFGSLLWPLAAVLGLLVFAGVVHLLASLFMARTLGFGATLRVVCYASASQLLAWLPILGFLASLYGIYVLVVGLRRVHGRAPGASSAL